MNRNIWTGYGIAPLFGPILYFIIALFIPEIIDRKESSVIQWLMSLLFFSFVSYVTCLVFGSLLILALNKIQKLNLIWFVFLGASLYSFSLYLTLFHILGGEIVDNKQSAIIYTLLTGFALGVVVTSVFNIITGITRR